MSLDRTRVLERSGPERLMASRDVSWVQLEPGAFEVRYGVLDAPPLTLSVRMFNLKMSGQVTLPPRSPMVYLATDTRTEARVHGISFDSSTIATTSSVIDVVTGGAAAFYSVTIDEQSLIAQFPNAPDATALLENISGVKLAQDPNKAQRVRAFFDRVFSMHLEAAGTGRRTEPLGERVCGALVPLLAETVEITDDYAVESSKCLSRRVAAVRSCEAYIRDHLDTRVTMLDLCQLTGMRSRSLINAFGAITGLAPSEYVKRLRLTGAHKALLLAEKTRTRITDIATDWGFWHLGHFNNDYRAMFGETPSQTLRSN